MIVIDTSAAMAIIARSQSSPASAMFEMTQTAAWISPSLFAFEVRHSILRLERKFPALSVVLREGLERVLAKMEPLDPVPDDGQLADAMALAREGGLSFYDACYVELALREQAELASRDTRLLAFAAGRGVPVHDLR